MAMNQFVKSLHRLYVNGGIDDVKVVDLCREGKIDEIEKEYILKTKEGDAYAE